MKWSQGERRVSAMLSTGLNWECRSDDSDGGFYNLLKEFQSPISIILTMNISKQSSKAVAYFWKRYSKILKCSVRPGYVKPKSHACSS